jgi:hypothetical protein
VRSPEESRCGGGGSGLPAKEHNVKKLERLTKPSRQDIQGRFKQEWTEIVMIKKKQSFCFYPDNLCPSLLISSFTYSHPV